jgi:hypothetical protein
MRPSLWYHDRPWGIYLQSTRFVRGSGGTNTHTHTHNKHNSQVAELDFGGNMDNLAKWLGGAKSQIRSFLEDPILTGKFNAKPYLQKHPAALMFAPACVRFQLQQGG